MDLRIATLLLFGSLAALSPGIAAASEYPDPVKGTETGVEVTLADTGKKAQVIFNSEIPSIVIAVDGGSAYHYDKETRTAYRMEWNGKDLVTHSPKRPIDTSLGGDLVAHYARLDLAKQPIAKVTGVILPVLERYVDRSDVNPEAVGRQLASGLLLRHPPPGDYDPKVGRDTYAAPTKELERVVGVVAKAGGDASRAFETELTQRVIAPEPVKDACETMCKLLTSYDKWKATGTVPRMPGFAKSGATPYKGTMLPAVSAAEAKVQQQGHAVVIRTIQALFIAKAAPLCPGNEKLLKKTLNEWAWYDAIHNPHKLKSPGAGNQWAGYAKTYAIHLLEELKENGSLRDVITSRELRALAADGSLLKKMRASLAADLGDKASFGGGNGGNSNLHVHGFSARLLALGPEEAAPAWEVLKKGMERGQQKLEEAKEKRNPLRIVYDIGRDLFPCDERGSASRGVMVATAKLQQEGFTPENKKYARQMLENFVLYTGSLLYRRLFPDTHWGTSNAAPYYWDPTIAYAMALNRMLLSDAAGDERRRLRETRDLLERALASRMRPDGLLRPMGGSGYADANEYVQPLAGTGFLVACANERRQLAMGFLDRFPGWAAPAGLRDDRSLAAHQR